MIKYLSNDIGILKVNKRRLFSWRLILIIFNIGVKIGNVILILRVIILILLYWNWCENIVNINIYFFENCVFGI